MRQEVVKNCGMTHDLLLALTSFAFVTSATPGPNNLMLMASGVNFGLRRSLPHGLGVSLGFGLMVFLVGLGLAGVFEAVPLTKLALKLVSVLYMLWLAWKIAHAAAPGAGRAVGQPLSFGQAAAFQWVNPKAWAMALGAIGTYGQGGVVLVALVFVLVNLPTVLLWVVLGERLRRVLQAPRARGMFNWTMAGLLVLSLWPVLEI